MTLTTDQRLPVTILSGFLSPDETRGGKRALDDLFPEFRGREVDAAPQAQGVG